MRYAIGSFSTSLQTSEETNEAYNSLLDETKRQNLFDQMRKCNANNSATSADELVSWPPVLGSLEYEFYQEEEYIF